MQPKSEKYYIVRCDRASVFFGQIAWRHDQEVTLHNVRRIWYWSGANELCELASLGTAAPGNCKLSIPVEEVTVLDALELIPCTDQAAKSLQEVEVWTIH